MNNLNDKLLAMIKAAISTDDVTGTEQGNGNAGFIDVMSARDKNIQKDIPAAFEMYTLLQHFSDSLPLFDIAPTALKSGIYIDAQKQTVVGIVPIPEDMLGYISCWITDSMHSAEVKRMPGLLALPFSIEKHDDIEMLIPEWFAVFYVDGSVDHCIPVLALKSVTEDERFGDWVDVALHRMEHFNLPAQAALSEIVKHQTHA